VTDEIKLRRWRTSTFWVMLIGYIGYYLCRGNLPASFGLLQKEFGYTNTELGLIATYSEVMYSAGKFINGPLADKLGGKKFFLLGMIGAILFNVLFTFGSSLIYFIAMWCGARFFLSMGWGGLIKVIGSWYEPERHGTIMGIISINFQFGGVAASIFAGWLVGQGVGWKGIFIYPALALTAILIWSALASKDSPQDVVPGTDFGKGASAKKTVMKADADHGGLETAKYLLKLPMFQKLLIFSFVAHVLRSVFIFWTPKLLLDLGMGNSQAIFNSTLFPLLGVIGTVLLGWYTDKYVHNGDRARPMVYLLAGLVATQLYLYYLTNLPDRPLIQIAVIIGLSGFFLFGPYSMSAGALSLDIAGHQRAGTCTGILDGFGYIGGALGVFLGGKLSDMYGWSGVFLAMAVSAVVSILAAWLLSRELRRHHAGEK
jgi:sugar phosphate permease